MSPSTSSVITRRHSSPYYKVVSNNRHLNINFFVQLLWAQSCLNLLKRKCFSFVQQGLVEMIIVLGNEHNNNVQSSSSIWMLIFSKISLLNSSSCLLISFSPFILYEYNTFLRYKQLTIDFTMYMFSNFVHSCLNLPQHLVTKTKNNCIVNLILQLFLVLLYHCNIKPGFNY